MVALLGALLGPWGLGDSGSAFGWSLPTPAPSWDSPEGILTPILSHPHTAPSGGCAPHLPPPKNQPIPLLWGFFPLSPSCPIVVYKSPGSARSREQLPKLGLPSPGAAGTPRSSPAGKPPHIWHSRRPSGPGRAQGELPGRAGGGRGGQRGSKHPGSGPSCAQRAPSARGAEPWGLWGGDLGLPESSSDPEEV